MSTTRRMRSTSLPPPTRSRMSTARSSRPVSCCSSTTPVWRWVGTRQTSPSGRWMITAPSWRSTSRRSIERCAASLPIVCGCTCAGAMPNGRTLVTSPWPRSSNCSIRCGPMGSMSRAPIRATSTSGACLPITHCPLGRCCWLVSSTRSRTSSSTPTWSPNASPATPAWSVARISSPPPTAASAPLPVRSRGSIPRWHGSSSARLPKGRAAPLARCSGAPPERTNRRPQCARRHPRLVRGTGAGGSDRRESVSDRTRANAATPVVQGLVEAGVFRTHAPRDIGGLEVDALTYFEALSRVDASVGWLAMINCGNFYSWFPFEVASELFHSAEPYAVCSGNLAPKGRAVPVADGYRVSGRWSFVSGIPHADFVLLRAPVADSNDIVAVVLPRGDFEIIPTWNGLGLRGTGRHDVAVNDVLVPRERTTHLEDCYPGQLYKAWFFLLGHAAHAVGIGRAAIDALIALSRSGPTPRAGALASRPEVQMALAEA